MSKFNLELLAPKPIEPLKRAPEGMNKFTMSRVYDQSGVSGTGVVAQGVEFATGHIAIQWLTPPPDGDLQTKDTLKKILEVHVFPHPENITVFSWEDSRVEIYPDFITLNDLKSKTVSELREKVKKQLSGETNV